MPLRRSIRSWGFLVAATCLAATANGQALVDRVPADAFVYVGWKGTDALGPAYDKSKFKTFIEASAIPKFLNETLPQIITKANKDEPGKADDLQLAEHFVKIIARHPTAFYVGGFEPKPEGGDPQPHLGIICQAGDDKATLLALFKKMAADQKDGDLHSLALDEGDVIAMVFGYADTERPLPAYLAMDGAKNTAPLKFDPARSHLVADPALVMYVNTAAALAKVDANLKSHQDEQDYAAWTRGRDASGLTGLKQYVYSAGFAGSDWASQTFIDAPAPRTGLLKLLEPAPLDPALLAKIPADATSASVGQFDFAELINTARDITTAVNPDAGQMFNKGMGFLSLSLGRRLDTELLAPLGSQWAMYTSPTLGSGPTAAVIVNKLDDPKLAKAAWSDFSFALSNTLPNLLRRQGITVVPKTDDQTVPGATVFTMSINTLPWSPGWVIKDDYMYLGADAAVLAKAATANAESKLDANTKFNGVLKGLAAPSYTAFSFNDLPATAPTAAANFDKIWTLASSKASEQGVDLPANLLPSLEKVSPLLEPSGSVSWADEKGFYAAEKSPFPLAAALYGSAQGEQAQLMSIGTVSMGVAILLPSLNKARETANRVKSAANLRQIGNGMILYSSENKGKAPPDLGTLLLQEDLTLSVFVCPSGDTSVPADVMNDKPEAQAAWVNEHSDYVYVNPHGFITKLTSDTPLAYEKVGLHGKDGINILYADGHVEFQQMAAAVDSLKQATGADPVPYDRKKKAATRP